MRDLLARLALHDEDASAALRVYDYFDALDASAAGPEAYLRGAAGLSSCGAGMRLPERHLTLRVGSGGQRLPSGDDFQPAEAWPQTAIGGEGQDRVWVETDEPSMLHELILERVVQGVRRWMNRIETLVPDPAQAWTALLNDPVPPERRHQLLAALKLDSSRTYQVVAHLPATPSGGLHAYTNLCGVAVGATIRRAPYDTEVNSGDNARVGVGPEVDVAGLLTSWERAAIVLRIARPGETTRWDRLGVLGPMFLHVSAEELLADPVVTAINSDTMPWLDQTVTAVTQTGSVRGAADLLQLHHSTVQKRLDKLQQEFNLNLANQRHVYHLWLALAAFRYATFGTPANLEREVRLTPRPPESGRRP